MDRRTTLVTAGVTALVTMTATAAVAVNTGLLSLPDDDVAGTLELPAATATMETPEEPVEVETVYVDVYDQPGTPTEQVVVVPAETVAGPTTQDTTTARDDDVAYLDDDEYEYDDDHDEYDDDHDEYDDDEYDDDEDEDHDEEDDEDEEDEEDEHEEYEGRDDDD